MLKVATFFHLLYFVHRHLLAFSSLYIAIVLPSRIMSRALFLENVIARSVNVLDGARNVLGLY